MKVQASEVRARVAARKNGRSAATRTRRNDAAMEAGLHTGIETAFPDDFAAAGSYSAHRGGRRPKHHAPIPEVLILPKKIDRLFRSIPDPFRGRYR